MIINFKLFENEQTWVMTIHDNFDDNSYINIYERNNMFKLSQYYDGLGVIDDILYEYKSDYHTKDEIYLMIKQIEKKYPIDASVVGFENFCKKYKPKQYFIDNKKNEFNI